MNFASKILNRLATEAPLMRRVGVAVSGGADSVALLSVLRNAGYECVALNCNFRLRGAESDRDTEHSRAIAAQLGCRFITTDFDVASQRRDTGESVEMACRTLRYQWFEQMAETHGLERIALGHHRNDRIETFFINALRGCGPRGLTSMRYTRGIYIRPLLGVASAEIREYLRQQGLTYVTDSSNLTSDYRRNAIRNEVMPLLRRHFPSADTTLAATVGYLEQVTDLYDHLVEQQLERYVSGTTIDASRIVAEMPRYASQLLFEATRLLGAPLNPERLAEVVRSADLSGRTFGPWHLDRGRLSLISTEPSSVPAIVTPATWPFATRYITPAEFRPERRTDKAWFDASILDGSPCFELRPWRTTDRMRPYGMKGSRLISDIYRDARYTLEQKQSTLLLVRNGEVVWIPGLKHSAHFPVTESTTSIVELEKT